MTTMDHDQRPDASSPYSAEAIPPEENPLASNPHALPARRGSAARRLAAAETPILGNQPALPPGLRMLASI